MVAFNPNWAAIAQILGGALAAPDGQYAQGAQQGAQQYQGMQDARQQQAYRDQQMKLAQEAGEREAAQFKTQQQQDQQWRDMFSPQQTAAPARQVGNYGASVGGAPGVQTASGSDPMQSMLAGLTPQQRAMLMMAGQEKGMGLLADWMKPQEPEGASSGVGKINEDFRRGLIDAATRDALLRKETYIATPQGPGPTETERLMRLAGIDPNSPEGKKIVTDKLSGSNAGTKPATPKELRDEYVKANKDYEQAMFGYGKVVQAAKNPSPAGDIALIFGFMKTMDPGSTVREGEFATAQNAGSVPERVVALYNSVLQGTRLTEAQRADFISQAGGQFKVYQDRKGAADQFYSGLAERSGISPQDVLVPYGNVPQYTPGRGGPTDERRRGTTVIDGVKIERLE